ncbi:MAG: thiamine pyrophosphate-binding protein, partial [Gammaproteobacteria bacterium]
MKGPAYSTEIEGDAACRTDSVVTSPVFENGDLILYTLEKIGVEYLFGIPGGAIEPLYNALARSQARGGIRSVIARHETGAAFMADGYTRESGIMGVCCSTTGPGATNLLTGVASAYENEIPMLVITAQTPLHTFGRCALQESSCTSVNTIGMFQFCTRYNSLVSHPAQLEHKLNAAIRTAHRPP